MTPEEINHYNNLTRNGKHFYDLYKGMHPEWDHGRLMTMASICDQDPFSSKRGGTTKEILSECIRKADQFMATNFPGLYPAVKEVFSKIGNAIKKAIQVTWEFLTNLFNTF